MLLIIIILKFVNVLNFAIIIIIMLFILLFQILVHLFIETNIQKMRNTKIN